MSSHSTCSASTDRLRALRDELDRVDDAIHDLLMRRAGLVADVARDGAKGLVPLRPGREAAMLRRLLGRNRPPLAPGSLVRLWRELLAGSSAQQRPMAVAVADAPLLDTARAHFGALTRLELSADPLGAVGAGAATLALMPWPGRWWTALAAMTDPPSVVAKLPVWRGGGPLPAALLLGPAAPDPSGADRSLLLLPDPAGAARFDDPVLTAEAGLVLADVAGFVTPGDGRLGPLDRLLGAYAIPFGDHP